MGNSAGDSLDDDPYPDDAFPGSAVESNGREDTPDRPESNCPTAPDGDVEPVLAELAVEHPNVVLGDAIDAAPAVTIEPNYRTTDERSSILVFTAVGESLDEFDAALATDHTVREPLLVAAVADARAYRVRYAPDTLRFTPVLAELGALLFDARSEGRGWSYHVRFPSRAAFTTFRTYCSTNGVSLTLSRLYRNGSGTGSGDHGLTPQQWETLSVAHEMGYFEVPRAITQEELASRLDVSPSAVSQRIRRATNRLLTATLESSRFGPAF